MNLPLCCEHGASFLAVIGGMRSDTPVLSFAPTIPDAWTSYSFRVQYRHAVIRVDVRRNTAVFTVVDGRPVVVRIYGQQHEIGARGLEIAMPVPYRPEI